MPENHSVLSYPQYKKNGEKDFIPFFHDRNDRIRKQKKGAVDISCGMKSWHATYTLKNLTYEKN